MMMKRPFVGDPVPFGDYVSEGKPRLHAHRHPWRHHLERGDVAQHPGVERRGFRHFLRAWTGCDVGGRAVGRVRVARFDAAPAGTNPLLAAMFGSFVIGLALIVFARFA